MILAMGLKRRDACETSGGTKHLADVDLPPSRCGEAGLSCLRSTCKQQNNKKSTLVHLTI